MSTELLMALKGAAWPSDLMSLFGSHDRNKGPTVRSRDRFPLWHHGQNFGLVLALHSCNSECCWFFAASQLSVWWQTLLQCECASVDSRSTINHGHAAEFMRRVGFKSPHGFFFFFCFIGSIGMVPIDSLSPSACSMQPKSSSL